VAVAGGPPEDPALGQRATGLRVGGFVPFSGNDFPGKLAAVVFCQGCPWRCGYCQDPHLIPRGAAEQGWDDILAWLDTRRGLSTPSSSPAASPRGGVARAMAAVRARDRWGPPAARTAAHRAEDRSTGSKLTSRPVGDGKVAGGRRRCRGTELTL
jgi:pyruvate-formate lyase-activating enzyme